MPAPAEPRSAWRNGWKIASFTSSGTPGPSSSTEIIAPPSTALTRMQTGDPVGVYFDALTRRFSTMRSTLPSSTEMTTRSDSTRAGWFSRKFASWIIRLASSRRSVGLRSGSTSPRSSRSRSRRSEIIRCSLRALESIAMSRPAA